MSCGKALASGAEKTNGAVEAACAGFSPEVKYPSSVTGLVVNIVASTDFTMEDYEEARVLIRKLFNKAAQVVIGLHLDASLADTVEITLLVGE